MQRTWSNTLKNTLVQFSFLKLAFFTRISVINENKGGVFIDSEKVYLLIREVH